MQKEIRADTHHEMALMRKAVETWRSRLSAVKMRGEATAGDRQEVDEDAISSSESIGRRSESSDCLCHFCTF